MRTIKHILVAVDLMEDSSFIAAYAKLFAEKLNSKMTVVYATPPLTQYFGLYLPQDTIAKFHEESEQGAIRELKEFVEKHGGQIKVESERKNGSEFKVILPLKRKKLINNVTKQRQEPAYQ